MKKLFIALFFVFLVPAAKTLAVELKTPTDDFQNNTTYTLELIATPKQEENAIKLNIIISGADIQEFSLYNEAYWLTTTNDCINGQKFTASSICTTLVKSEEIKQNESLGFLKIFVTDASKLTIYKIDGTEYSDGLTARSSTGELLKLSNLSTSVASSELPIYGNLDPILFYFAIGGILTLIIVIAFVAIKLFKPNKTMLNI